jgi:hypothetical protein
MRMYLLMMSMLLYCNSFAAEQFVSFGSGNIEISSMDKYNVYVDDCDYDGVKMAVENLQNDIKNVTSNHPSLTSTLNAHTRIIIGTIGKSAVVDKYAGKFMGELKGKNEKFIITTVSDKLLILGSDKRGTIYGIYELSRQIGVSPWNWWADVPVAKHPNLYIKGGVFTDGEPAVKYRGIFINDEWPAMGNWTTEKYGGFNSKMYVHVFELLLRLKANFLWPAMWSSAFYADDPQNGKLADKMGIIIGTSHHEPMGRNHQEYARHRDLYGSWNYQINQKRIDQFFTEGIRRMKGTEDVVTIAMRGDGDAPMGPGTDTKQLENIVANQRKIIEKVTGKPAKKTPQVWALYSEVLDYYDKGMKIPDDVMILLCDDNWGDVRRLPSLTEKKHSGGYGMYYHVDLHGAPRAYQWLNMTQIQHIWEQMQATYDYGVDKMWILNVGDIKPMEFPMSFFLNMAWNPKQMSEVRLNEYTRNFCAQQFGELQADEAAYILNLYCKYCSRVSAEMLDDKTYNLESGEFKTVKDEFVALEAHALRQYLNIPDEYRDAYQELILFPVQAMANLYEMYYALAMNKKAFKNNDRQSNYYWADKVVEAFGRDSILCDNYNHRIAGGKWNHMMDQVHIGYSSWDAPQKNIIPSVSRLDPQAKNEGGILYAEKNGVVVMEAEHYNDAKHNENVRWGVIPDLGRTLSGVALMPYTMNTEGCSLTYKMRTDSVLNHVKVYVTLGATLPFNVSGHRFNISIDGEDDQTVNFNHDYDWAHCYTKMYPAGAARMIETSFDIDIRHPANIHTLTLHPLDPGIVFFKIVMDCGGYEKTHLYMSESPYERE